MLALASAAIAMGDGAAHAGSGWCAAAAAAAAADCSTGDACSGEPVGSAAGRGDGAAAHGCGGDA